MHKAIIERLLDRYGGAVGLAARLGISRQAVWQWTKVPLKYVRIIEQDTGIPREKLRPDIYA